MSTCQKSELPIIPVSNPKANYLAHKEEIDEAIAKVLEKGQYILGEEVEAFEEEFSRYIGVDYCVGVASGTDALILALKALDLPTGTTVVTSALSASATPAAIYAAGHHSWFTDISVSLMGMARSHYTALLAHTREPGVFMPVHLYGFPDEACAVEGFTEGVHTVEDCAQAHGAMYADKRVGSFGDMGAFSFYPTKNLGCIGDGGAIVTDNAEYATRLRELREYGWKLIRGFSQTLGGRASRLDEIQAAVLRVKLKYLDAENRKRKGIALRYAKGLWDLPLGLPTVLAYSCRDHVYHQFVVRVQNRNHFKLFLYHEWVSTAIHYESPLHKQPAFATYQHLPVVEKFCQQCVSLPMYPELTDEEVERVIDAVRGYYERE